MSISEVIARIQAGENINVVLDEYYTYIDSNAKLNPLPMAYTVGALQSTIQLILIQLISQQLQNTPTDTTTTDSTTTDSNTVDTSVTIDTPPDTSTPWYKKIFGIS